MMNNYAFPYPQVALPHQALAPEYQAIANAADTKPPSGRQQGFYDANIAPWAINNGVAEQPQQTQHRIMHPYGFSLPNGYPPLHYPSPAPAHAAIPMPQQRSQGSSSFDARSQSMGTQQTSFSSMSSGGDSQCSDAHADTNTHTDNMGTDEGKLEDFFASCSVLFLARRTV